MGALTSDVNLTARAGALSETRRTRERVLWRDFSRTHRLMRAKPTYTPLPWGRTVESMRSDSTELGHWKLDALHDGTQMIPPLAEARAELQFALDGKLFCHDSVNTAYGRYSLGEDGTMHMTLLGETLGGPPKWAQNQDNLLRAALTSASRLLVRGNSLALLDSQGSALAIFLRAASH